ncbi:MAG: hypothetical protein WKF96_01700 [Solirubrobacteraceae bacterium]
MSDATDESRPEQPSGAAPSVGEDFRLISSLMPSMPEDAVRQLHHALGARLALPSSSVRRRERLAVLSGFLGVHGRAPTASEYREEYTRRKERGEPAVPVSTLEGYYGSYAEAVDWAVKLYVRGTAARVQAGQRGNKPPNFWTQPQCLDAVEEVRKLLGHWPEALEFAAVRRAGEALRVVTGGAHLILPWPPVIERLFGSYGEMLAEAKRRENDHSRARGTTQAIERAGPATSSTGPSHTDRSVRRRPRSSRVTAPRHSG